MVAANRDEFYARPTLSAHWWDEPGIAGIFGGRDLQARGTWLAVSSANRLAAVTNWTADPNAPRPPGSRGDLPREFLGGDASARDFIATIDGSRYLGFNFIAYDGEELLYTSNRTGEIRALSPGVYGLTNSRLGAGLAVAAGPDPGTAERPAGETWDETSEQWPKAAFGALALREIAATATPDDLIELLSKPLVPEPSAPPGSASPCFIRGAEYGTRASTAVIIGRQSIAFAEQQYGPFGKPGQRTVATIDPGQQRRATGNGAPAPGRAGGAT